MSPRGWAAVAFLAWGSALAAEPEERNVGGGPGLHVEAVLSNGVTAGLEYQLPLALGVRLTPTVSAGLALATGADRPMPRFGWSAGLHLEWGYTHRLLIGANYGTRGTRYTCDPAGCTELGTYLGPNLIAGYKGVARFGLMWFVYLGWMAYQAERLVTGPDVGFGLGYKF